MSSSHSTITYTSESDIDGSPFGIDLADLEDVSEEEPAEQTDPYEEELPAQAAPIPAKPDPTLSSTEENEPFEEDELSSLGTLADTTPLVASPPLPLSSARSDPIPEDDIPPQKRARFSSLSYRLVVALEETNERVADLRTSYRQNIHEMYVRIHDA
ncbi:hypothetical protein Tco_0934309 [Tanacetum coccineum]